MTNKRKRILIYAIYGFILGLFFPVAASAAELLNLNARLTWPILRAIHLGHPLMLLIDLAPIVLSASFALIGIQSARFLETSSRLDEQLKTQASNIENEHYFLEALIASSSFAVVRLDTKQHIITCNKAFEDLFGYQCDEIVGEYLDNLIASDDLLVEATQISGNVSSGILARKISQRKRKDGSLVDVEIVGIPVSVGGKNIGILGLYHDISDRKRAEQALLESEARFKSLFNESPISLWEEDFSDVKRILEQYGDKEQIIERLNQDYELVLECSQAVKVLDINQATLDLYNAKSKADLVQNLSQVLVIESMEEFRGELIAMISGETTFECAIYQKKLTGELIYGLLRFSIPPGYENTWERVHISIIDITERKETEEKLRFMSFHDALTGLYNRAYFEEELARLDGGRQYPVSIIAGDLDGLKQINDQLGHDAGDRAIKAAAKVLGLNTFRKEDVVARIGGDEFIVILPSVDLDQNPAIYDRINDGLDQFNNSDLDDDLYRPISLSLGYAVVQEGESLKDGYKSADKAMYISKSKKKTKQD
ncbi:MAG: diguanylate cyclase domain-containing protein, partial [Anaerolineales bacterium]